VGRSRPGRQCEAGVIGQQGVCRGFCRTREGFLPFHSPQFFAFAQNRATIGAGVPADEEITEAMLDVGLAEASGFELQDAWEGYLSRADLGCSIFHAMDRVREKC
jgi:hypothetical protein